jgi:hypothetical protein
MTPAVFSAPCEITFGQGQEAQFLRAINLEILQTFFSFLGEERGLANETSAQQ